MTPYNIPTPVEPFLNPQSPPMSVPWYRFMVDIFQTGGSGQATKTLTEVIKELASQSISLIVPSWLTVTGSPIVGGTGTFTIDSAKEPANLFLASPDSLDGPLAPRRIVGADLPNPQLTELGGVRELLPVAHKFVNAITGLGVAVAVQPSSSDLSDTVVPTAWTPTDESGASLVFTAISAQYSKYGNNVYAYGTLTYPTTADTSDSLVSLPIKVPNQSYAELNQPIYLSGASGAYAQFQQNTSTVRFYNSTGTRLTNANLSTDVINFSFWYPAS